MSVKEMDKIFARVMKNARKRRGIMHEELAELAGISVIYCFDI